MDRRNLLAEALMRAPRERSILDNPDPIANLRENMPLEPSRYGAEATLPTPGVAPLLPRSETGGFLATQPQMDRTQRIADMLMNFAGTTPMRGVQGVRAFHGSPHDFDRFRMDRIGTGEGAQAYGHGLYFAENEGVARLYRDTLSSGQQGLRTIGNAPDDITARISDISQRVRGGGTFDDVLRRLGDERDYHLRDAQGVWERNMQPRDAEAVWRISQDRGMRAQADMDFLIENQRYLAPHQGHMYEVNLRVDPNRLLDWDAPLSGQPQAVRDALVSGGIAPASRADPTYVPPGAPRWMRPGDHSSMNVGTFMRDTLGTPEGAAQLRDAGIPGVRYLDQGSRVAGDGTRNYVMFDDSLIEILRKYGLAGLGIGMGAAATQAEAGQ